MKHAQEDLGYRQRSRTYTPPAEKRQAMPSGPRPVPRVDPELLNSPKENDFTRWYAEECRRKGIQNKLL